MSFASFFAALSGLQANATRLSVIGNNLANVNTVGFKSGRVTFHDFFSGASSVGFNGAGNPAQVGRGVNIASIDSIFSQGSLQTTSVLTDLAIEGRGFFVLADDAGGLAFSRAGNFSFDQDGNLVSSSGLFVQGFTAQDAAGNVVTSGALNNIRIPSGLVAPPQATTEINASINLDSRLASDFLTTLTIFDSLGGRHDLTMKFTPTDTTVPPDGNTDSWAYDITLPGAEVSGGVPGTPFSVASGILAFDSQGQLTSPAADLALSIPGWTNGAAAQNVTWTLFDPSTANSLITGFEATSAIASSNQDGFAVGTLRTLVIAQDGLVSGIFTNGVDLQLARIALSTFNNESGLLRAGRNTYLETNSSGSATIGTPDLGGRGSLVANSLELSNVDITTEFTDLIISQRGYQANSRIITTTDEIIQEALSLKR